MPDLSFNVIDNLTYTYNDVARPDRLTNMSDAGSATKGFKYKTVAAASLICVPDFYQVHSKTSFYPLKAT